MRPAATKSSISIGSGGPAEIGAACAAAAQQTTRIAHSASNARAPRRSSALTMTSPPLRAKSLRLQLGVPIEIIEPAIVQIVRREQPAVLVQMMHRRLERHLRGPHLGFLRRQVALAQVAGREGRHHVVPSSMPPARARQDVVEGQVLALATI